MLLTKLHISPPGNQTVHRTGLFEKLATGLKTKLMLLSAPAGSGKTTLVSDWIIQQNIPAAWYALDDGDNDVAKFLSYLITAVQRIHPEFGKGALRLLQAPNQLSRESVVNLLINELLSFLKHFVLVLDDFHVIHNREVLNLFTYFIEHLPPAIHLVLLTRADPLLPIAKLRSQHQLVELRSADLSFSANDIHFLFNRKLKQKLSLADVQVLAHKTEGWIAGLQLIALSLRDREDTASFIRDFKGDNRYIMDYLIEEVLRQQPPEIQDFLLRTSLLEQLSGPLSDAVLDRQDGQSVLEMLEKNNMFIVSLDAERKWYRYHHLFADLLRQRLVLSQNKPALLALHAKAGAWFEEHQMYPLAIGHLLQAQDYDKAIRLLAASTEDMWKNGQHASILKYGDLLPQEVIGKHPGFGLFYAWVLMTAGQIQKAGPLLASAETIARQEMAAGGKAAGYYKKLAGKIAVAIAYQHSLLGRPEISLEYCRTALENLSEEDPLWFSWGWYAVGMAQIANENIVESTEALKKALAFGKRSGNIYLITTIAITLAYNETRLGLYKVSYKRSADLVAFLQENGYAALVKADWTFAVMYANMAAIRYFWADLEGASETIKTAYHLCIQAADVTSKVLVLIIYSVILHGQGDVVGAEMKIKEMEAILQKNQVNPFLQSMYIGWKGIFLVGRNELEKARAFFEVHEVAAGNAITYAEEYRYIALSMLLLAEHKPEEAYRLLSRLLDMARAQSRMERIIEINILFSIILLVKGEKEQALACLTESLGYAAPDEILMYHLNYLDQISPLLQEVFKNQATGKGKLPHTYINKLKRTIEKRQHAGAGQLGLTNRERETLQWLAEDLSNQEIADKLFISLNTVKTRLKNLFAKLEVDSRSKAVEKARVMRLI